MVENESYWHALIHKIKPDLDIKNVELYQEGLVSNILIVNHEWVIRFTKTAWGKELLDQEHQLMEYLKPRLTLSIPSSVRHSDGVLIYPYLAGETFRREFWEEVDQAGQQKLADQLGQFLKELHHAPTADLDWELPLTLAPVTRETWVDIYDRLVEKVQPLLLPYQIKWMTSLFEPALSIDNFFDFDPVIIHGDLMPLHILYRPDVEALNSVINFGSAGLGDPATDLGSLISAYGETLVSRLAGSYPDYESLLTRARFYARALELQWVLLGVESSEYYWFTSHLGGPRDIR